MIDAVDINHQLEKIKMANSPIYFHMMLGLNCLRVAWLRTGIHTWLIAVSSARSTVVIDADEITQCIEGIDKAAVSNESIYFALILQMAKLLYSTM